MSKYYRVRSQQEWDWLMQWFEKQDENIRWVVSHELPTMFNAYDSYLNKTVIDKNDREEISYSGLDYFQQNEGVTDFIEVSQMMEEGKMEDYVTISRDDLFQIEDQDGEGIVQVDGKGEFSIPDMPIDEISIPKSLLYPKVRMSVAEKKEFDDVKKYTVALYSAMVIIFDHKEEYQNLNIKLFYSAPPKYLNDIQRDFSRAWADPSLIEVVPEKHWNVKVPPFERTNKYYYKDGRELRWAGRVGNDDEDQQFTADELKEYGLDDDMYEKVEVTDDGTK